MALVMLSGTRTVSAAPCPPSAELAGERITVERVAGELRRLGVAVTVTPDVLPADAPPAAHPDGCAVVRAFVQLDDGGAIAVAVRGAGRSSEGRVMSDPVLAAAWIDSWTRDDIDVALWAAPPARVATAASPAVNPPRDAIPAPASAPRGVRDRVTLAAAYEEAWSDDDARWRGASAAACVQVDGFCVGARARAVFDPARLVGATAMARDDLSLLATASYPLALGTMTVAPELGLGVGRLSTKRVDGTCTAPPPSCDPMDPTCVVPEPTCDPGTSPVVAVGDGLHERTYAVRFALALRVAVPLFRHVSLDGLAGVGWSPFAHTAMFPAGTTTSPMMAPPDTLALPGEPRTSYQLGIGLRVGAR